MAITAVVAQLILESGMKLPNASKMDLCHICMCDYDACIYDIYHQDTDVQACLLAVAVTFNKHFT